MHHQGDLLGLGSVWGYVEGGLGRVSFAIAAGGARGRGGARRRACRSPRSAPARGSSSSRASRIRAPVVVCNADPKRMLAMLDAGGAEVPGRLPRAARGLGRALAGDEAERRARTASRPSPRRRRDRAAAGAGDDHRRGRRRPGRGRGGAPRRARRSASASSTSRAPTTARSSPTGREVMSVFCQYVPVRARRGRLGLASRRDRRPGPRRDRGAGARRARLHRGDAGAWARPTSSGGSASAAATSSRARRCREQMWDRRLEARTPIEGLYLCGAATHPGGCGDRAQRPDRRRAGARGGLRRLRGLPTAGRIKVHAGGFRTSEVANPPG